MSTFPERWLALREPFDHAARAEALVHRLPPLPRPLRVVELGCGLGSGFRWLAPRLRGPQEWWLIDHDPALLDALPDAVARWGSAHGPVSRAPDRVSIGDWTVRWQQADVRALDSLPEADLVSLQALLDLASHDWLVSLADWLDHRAVPLLAALTVDGRVSWRPHRPSDAEVQAAFRLHQLGDRGFGTSPGPGAARLLADLLRVRGWSVTLRRADWQVPASSTGMLDEMVRGTAQAAGEVHPTPDRIDRWRLQRLEDVEQGRLSLMVGHLDLVARPPAR